MDRLRGRPTVELDGLRHVTPVDPAADPDVLFDEVHDAIAAHEVAVRRLQPHRATLEESSCATPVTHRPANTLPSPTRARPRDRATPPPPSAIPAPGPHDRGGRRADLRRGYRRYEGERLGRGAAVRAVWAQAFQRILGMRRPIWTKILPILVVFLSYVPAIVFIGLVSLTKNDPNVASALPRYSDYYKNVLLAVLLLTAFSAPDALCPDRRTGMLGIYLASPLTRDTYLLGKALAVFTALMLVTTGPQLLMLVANSLQGSGVGAASTTTLMVLRIVGAGVAVSALFTSLSMAISSLTDRKGFATAAIILVLLTSGAVAGALSSDHPTFTMISLAADLPNALTTRIFGVPAFEDSDAVSTGLVYLAALAWTVAGIVVVQVRYRLLRVTR